MNKYEMEQERIAKEKHQQRMFAKRAGLNLYNYFSPTGKNQRNAQPKNTQRIQMGTKQRVIKHY